MPVETKRLISYLVEKSRGGVRDVNFSVIEKATTPRIRVRGSLQNDTGCTFSVAEVDALVLSEAGPTKLEQLRKGGCIRFTVEGHNSAFRAIACGQDPRGYALCVRLQKEPAVRHLPESIGYTRTQMAALERIGVSDSVQISGVTTSVKRTNIRKLVEDLASGEKPIGYCGKDN